MINHPYLCNQPSMVERAVLELSQAIHDSESLASEVPPDVRLQAYAFYTCHGFAATLMEIRRYERMRQS